MFDIEGKSIHLIMLFDSTERNSVHDDQLKWLINSVAYILLAVDNIMFCFYHTYS